MEDEKRVTWTITAFPVKKRSMFHLFAKLSRKTIAELLEEVVREKVQKEMGHRLA